jgi:hypothetical protein
VERHVRPIRDAVKQLEEITKSWIVDSERGTSDRKIPEVEWRKMRSLEFQETLLSRGALEKANRDRSCLLCPDFDTHVSPFARLGTEVERLYDGGAPPRLSVFSMKFFMGRRSCGKNWTTSGSQSQIRTWS